MRLTHPCPGARISQYFGENPGKFGYGPEGHQGVDFGVVVGTLVRAPISGRVVVGNDPDGYGLYALIERGPVWMVLAHLSEILQIGDVVAGEPVALSGNSGNSSAPHIHFEIRIEGQAVDPLPYLEEGTMDRPSVLGVQIQTPPEVGGAGTDAIRNSKIPWVKGINPEEWAPDIFPNQEILAREWIGGDQREAEFYRRGSAGARDYFETLRPRYDRLKSLGILDVEGPNEPQATCGYGDDPEQYAYDWGVIAEFSYEWARLVADYGMRPWVFQISVGQPHQAVWPLLLNATKAASDAGGGIGVHEYGAPSVQSGGGWWTLRLKRMLEAWGDPDVRIIVSECGIDGGVMDAAHARWGWLKFAQEGWVYTEPDSMGLGQTIMTPELYWRQTRWYDQELCNIPQVVAALPFIHNPNSEWESFNWRTEFIERTAALYEGWAPEPDDAAIIARAHEIVLPLNPDAGLAKAGIARGFTPASDEDYELGFPIQVFRTADDYGRIHTGVWQNGQVRWIEDEN